jgi:dihydroorotate dehydrogenase
MSLLYPLSRRLLFRLDPETAHGLSIRAMAQIGSSAALRRAAGALFAMPESPPIRAFGLTFPNRVGLAAGYDKDGEAWRGLGTLGFGHIEIGTVTPEPQPGNPKPRVFRLTGARSLINRLGFPGRGAAFVVRQLESRPPDGPILGVNIGKQKTTPLEEALHDYQELVDVFAPLADYLAVNISSPNTPGLRRLQEPAFLGDLLGGIATRRSELVNRLHKPVPVLVKLAPDLTDRQLDGAVDAIAGAGLDGIIATNTTIDRAGLDHPLAREEGGLSGAALGARSTEVVARIAERVHGALPIVGVGGIMGPDDARAKLDAGATLVQIYTGLVYEGPGLVKRIVSELSRDNPKSKIQNPGS